MQLHAFDVNVFLAAAGFNSAFIQALFTSHAASSAASPAGPAPQPAGSVLPNGPSLSGFHASGEPMPQQASGVPALTLPVQGRQMIQCCCTVADALVAESTMHFTLLHSNA